MFVVEINDHHSLASVPGRYSLHEQRSICILGTVVQITSITLVNLEEQLLGRLAGDSIHSIDRWTIIIDQVFP